MPGPRKATRIQAAAQKIRVALADLDAGMDWQEGTDRIRELVDEIIDMADRQDARTGRLDPSIRKAKRKG